MLVSRYCALSLWLLSTHARAFLFLLLRLIPPLIRRLPDSVIWSESSSFPRNLTSGRAAHVPVDPFVNADMLWRAADMAIDLREPLDRERVGLCQQLIQAQQRVNTIARPTGAGQTSVTFPLIVYVRTDSLFAFLSDLDPYCLDTEPVLLVGDSDVGVPTMTLATHPGHTLAAATAATAAGRPRALPAAAANMSVSSAVGTFRRRRRWAFVQNWDGAEHDLAAWSTSSDAEAAVAAVASAGSAPTDTIGARRSPRVVPIPLGVSTGQWVLHQLNGLCAHLHARWLHEVDGPGHSDAATAAASSPQAIPWPTPAWMLPPLAAVPRTRLLYVCMKLRTNVRERLAATRAVRAIKGALTEAGVDADAWITAATGCGGCAR